LKLEDGLQKYHELKTKIFIARVDNINGPPVKQIDAGSEGNVNLEDSRSQIADQEEFKQSDTQEEPYQAEDSNSGKSKKDGSYSPAKPKTLSYEEELAR
jgi:hypothetical protein